MSKTISTIEGEELELRGNILVDTNDDVFARKADLLTAWKSGGDTDVDVFHLEDLGNSDPSREGAYEVKDGSDNEPPDPSDYSDGEESGEYRENLAKYKKVAFHVGCKEFDKKNADILKAWLTTNPEADFWREAVKRKIVSVTDLPELRRLAKKFNSDTEKSLVSAGNLKKLA